MLEVQQFLSNHKGRPTFVQGSTHSLYADSLPFFRSWLTQSINHQQHVRNNSQEDNPCLKVGNTWLGNCEPSVMLRNHSLNARPVSCAAKPAA